MNTNESQCAVEEDKTWTERWRLTGRLMLPHESFELSDEEFDGGSEGSTDEDASLPVTPSEMTPITPHMNKKAEEAGGRVAKQMSSWAEQVDHNTWGWETKNPEPENKKTKAAATSTNVTIVESADVMDMRRQEACSAASSKWSAGSTYFSEVALLKKSGIGS